ncbi:hypothetical protein NG895_12340 [Aeoliella sp. ICT_H6.2]|uniref:Uncharacterized protein n=1 Tax=Aeoliella straminimaris TaxID=2954799 RepID=A0A9X2JHJ1_9BACT|nr:hypothetical protein [Aeoliella straminimaris]MCO6044698.1 hypothetical protein [Aeoliella straminimaris]
MRVPFNLASIVGFLGNYWLLIVGLVAAIACIALHVRRDPNTPYGPLVIMAAAGLLAIGGTWWGAVQQMAADEKVQTDLETANQTLVKATEKQDQTIAEQAKTIAELERTQEMLTGGDGAIFLEFTDSQAVLRNTGKYPVHDVRFVVVDLTKGILDWRKNPNKSAKEVFNQQRRPAEFETIRPGGRTAMYAFRFPPQGARHYYVIEASVWTSIFRQFAVIDHTEDGAMTYAYKVVRCDIDKLRYQDLSPPVVQVDEDFPRNAEGKVDWIDYLDNSCFSDEDALQYIKQHLSPPQATEGGGAEPTAEE